MELTSENIDVLRAPRMHIGVPAEILKSTSFTIENHGGVDF